MKVQIPENLSSLKAERDREREREIKILDQNFHDFIGTLQIKQICWRLAKELEITPVLEKTTGIQEELDTT